MSAQTAQTPNREICLLLDSSQPGGIETHVFELATALTRAGHSSRVLFLADHGPHPLRERLLQLGVACDTLDGRVVSLLRMLQRQRPAILHTHGYKAGILGRSIARLLGIAVFSTYHAGETGIGRMRLNDWFDRYTAFLASGVFAVSNDIAGRLPRRAIVLDNFIDTADIAASRGEQIAFVGRLSHEKGPDHFAALAAGFPGQRFHVYGDGPLGESLRAEAPQNLQFHGLQSNMSTVWPNISLLVMPSRQEGLPMAALEAMARGIPLLASQVGALPELVQTGYNGWLVQAGDHDALHARLCEWLALDDTARQQIRQRARERVETRFSAAVAIPALLEHYARSGKGRSTL